MGILFCIGSACFALGSLPLYFEHVSASITASTFFIGSIFFTSASYVQWRESFPTPGPGGADAPPGIVWPRRRPLVGWRPDSPDWWAAIIQFAGTIMFNISTFSATLTDLSLGQQKQLIWAPDVYGSICFLVSSVIAYVVAARGRLLGPAGPLGWRIAVLNLAGSIAFGFAAISGRYLPTTGEIANIRIVNLGTCLGALCFFVAAALLPALSARSRPRPDPTPSGAAGSPP
jgi:hypothetical protein